MFMTLTICPKFTVDNEDGDELNREQSLLVQIGNEFVKSCPDIGPDIS
jgi:hypothetical protein